MTARWLSPAAAVAAMLPGFLLPFAVTLVMPTTVGDSYLLAASIAVTLASVVGNAIELNTASEYGRILGRGELPDRAATLKYRKRVFAFAVTATSILGIGLLALYGARSDDEVLFLTLGGIALCVPLLGSVSALRSGYLIASGKAHLAVLMQAPRTLVPLVVLIVVPGVGAIALMAAFVLGEVVRLAALLWLTRGTGESTSGVRDGMQTTGLWWQSSSAAVSQGGPVVDRAFLAPVDGGVSAYELADKLFFTPVQFLNLGFLVPRVGRWSRIPSMEAQSAKQMLRRDFVVLLASSLLIGAVATVVLVWWANSDWFPASWRQGALWGAILAMSLPLGIGIMSCGRLLIVARKQHWLLWFSAITLVLNLVGDAWLFFWLGPVGIPIATVIVRAISFIAYVVVIIRLLPHVWGSERSENA